MGREAHAHRQKRGAAASGRGAGRHNQGGSVPGYQPSTWCSSRLVGDGCVRWSNSSIVYLAWRSTPCGQRPNKVIPESTFPQSECVGGHVRRRNPRPDVRGTRGPGQPPYLLPTVGGVTAPRDKAIGGPTDGRFGAALRAVGSFSVNAVPLPTLLSTRMRP